MSQITSPEDIEKLLRAAIKAGRETELIAPNYLETIENIIPQMYRKQARRDLKAAVGKNKTTIATHKVKKRRAKAPE